MRVEGVSGGGYCHLVDGFDGVGVTGVCGGAAENGAESSPADLLRNDVVSLEVLAHHFTGFHCDSEETFLIKWEC